MTDVDKAIIAKLKKNGKNFEILVDCEKAYEFKKNKTTLDECLASDTIFTDAKKGIRASETDLEKIFGTKDGRKIAERIIKEGQIQETQKHKEQEKEIKLKQIINIIHRNAIDPKTGLPHPPQRIENAIQEAGVNINESKTAEEQVEDVLSKLRPIIPIKLEKRQLEIQIPAKFAGSSFHVLKKFGKLTKDEWLNDGSLKAVIEIPAGIQDEFFSELNKICHGEVESKVIKVI